MRTCVCTIHFLGRLNDLLDHFHINIRRLYRQSLLEHGEQSEQEPEQTMEHGNSLSRGGNRGMQRLFTRV